MEKPLPASKPPNWIAESRAENQKPADDGPWNTCSTMQEKKVLKHS